MRSKIYYCSHRLYRSQDMQYWNLNFMWEAESLGELDRLIKTYEAALVLASAEKLTLEKISVDLPNAGGAFVTVFDAETQRDIQYFLGLKRDRRHKAPPKTEEEIAEQDTEVLADMTEPDV